jgi:hypothetical protein
MTGRLMASGFHLTNELAGAALAETFERRNDEVAGLRTSTSAPAAKAPLPPDGDNACERSARAAVHLGAAAAVAFARETAGPWVC